jgi:hypothetical protein
LPFQPNLKSLVDFIQSVALDNIAFLVFIERSKADSTLNPLFYLVNLVLVAAESRHLTIKDRLLTTENSSVCGAGDLTTLNDTTGGAAFIDFEDLLN